MLGMVMVAVLAQSGECRFKADWWLNFDVEVTTLNGEMLGKIPARFDTDVPAAKADVVLRDGLAEVVLSHRGARLKFVTKALPFSAPSDPLDCAALRLGSPATSPHALLATIAPADEPKATEAGARTVELLRGQAEIVISPESPRSKTELRVHRTCPNVVRLFSQSSEAVGKLATNTPCFELAHDPFWALIRLEGALSELVLFVRRTELMNGGN